MFAATLVPEEPGRRGPDPEQDGEGADHAWDLRGGESLMPAGVSVLSGDDVHERAADPLSLVTLTARP